MKTFAADLLAAISSGCIWDHSSVEPRSVITIQNPGNGTTGLARSEKGALPYVADTNEPPDLGVAPYVSNTSGQGGSAATNSLTGVNAPQSVPSLSVVPTNAIG